MLMESDIGSDVGIILKPEFQRTRGPEKAVHVGKPESGI